MSSSQVVSWSSRLRCSTLLVVVSLGSLLVSLKSKGLIESELRLAFYCPRAPPTVSSLSLRRCDAKCVGRGDERRRTAGTGEVGCVGGLRHFRSPYYGGLRLGFVKLPFLCPEDNVCIALKRVV